MLPDIDYTTGIHKLWEEEEEYQTAVLEGIISNIRHIENPEILKLHFNYLKTQGAFFVHNDDYMIKYFGEAITEPKYGVYNFQGRCTLAARLAIPIRLFDNTVRGFIGYSNKPADYAPDEVFIKYLYPSKNAFYKGRFFYMTADEYRKAVHDEYVCIVDGIFDKIILQCLGINAVSLCGSSLTEWHTRYLSFIKHKIVIADNDVAGRRFSSYCRYALENCIEILQPETNDIDEFLRDDKAVASFRKQFEEMKAEGFLLSRQLMI